MDRVLAAEAGSHLEHSVIVEGHAQAIRHLGNNLMFVLLRDRSGTLQLVIDDPTLLLGASQLRLESPLRVTGLVHAHPSNVGAVEVRATEIEILSPGIESLPVEIHKSSKLDTLSISSMFDYRPLTVRSEKARAIFKIEAAICQAFRHFLTKEGFIAIHSPKIVSTGTEGGAQLFALQYFEKQAFLAQSPQFYKQIMVGAFERVFEIAAVYRAEEHDTTRHLNEYISMDLEMGFIANAQDLMALQTKLLKHIFAHLDEYCAKELALFKALLPQITDIPQISLAEACHLVAVESEKRTGKAGISRGPITDLDPDGERLLCEIFKEKEGSSLVYVTRYPKSVRPFYAMPVAGTELTESFDLLFAGLEITTGGQRIHNHEALCASIQERGLDPLLFKDYLQCFRYGMPPHGGLAIGLERLTKQLLGLPSVKLAALFPRDRNRISP